jgi:hypothetical protein
MNEKLLIKTQKNNYFWDYAILLILGREGLFFFANLPNELSKCFIDISSSSIVLFSFISS